MTVVILSTVPDSYETWELTGRPAMEMGYSRDLVYPYPIQGGVRALYKQKCRDTVSGIWTPWTTNFQDIYGSRYPGAGFSSATYRIVGTVYDREQ